MHKKIVNLLIDNFGYPVFLIFSKFRQIFIAFNFSSYSISVFVNYLSKPSWDFMRFLSEYFTNFLAIYFLTWSLDCVCFSIFLFHTRIEFRLFSNFKATRSRSIPPVFLCFLCQPLLGRSTLWETSFCRMLL